MYNLDHIVRWYFSAVSVKSILAERGGIRYNDFPEEEFLQISKAYMHQYSDTENFQLYRYIKHSIHEEGHPFAGMKDRSGLNVFATLEELAEQLLITEDNETMCKYSSLLRFRQITNYIEEDLLVCAYYAMRFKRFRNKQVDFAWNTTIDHNNVQLKRIIQRGISENHFHLYGSAPSFHLMWIYFMNHVASGALSDFSKETEKRQRMTREHYNLRYSEEAFGARILKAALIRICIIYALLDLDTVGEEKEGEDTEERNEDLILPSEGFKLRRDGIWIQKILSGSLNIEDYYYQIQTMIDFVRDMALLNGLGELPDYALYKAGYTETSKAECCWFAGERWMMYHVLVDELKDETDRRLADIYYQWFYAYLVIKQNVRSELLQVNDTIGFENFQIYNGRKNVYSDYGKMIESAVYGSIGSGNIQSLEIRVLPQKSAEENAKMIFEIDEILGKRSNPISRNNYYYVFHFAKRRDEALPPRECFDGCYCRHYKHRKGLEERANAIYEFRENYRELASNMLGIDACSQEIGCRPEVFAVVFRFLSEHVVEDVVGEGKIAQLKMTYHVGEDFLDIVDGLRAVDEAVHFLNLQCGDRIGHGTVLGIDVEKWYLLKKHTIVITSQDYLDNVVWLYHKLIEYGLEGFGNLKQMLVKEFDFYFSRIYMESEARENIIPSIYAYYEAWKLRGDEPSLYMGGKFGNDNTYKRSWLINKGYPDKFMNRMREEVALLYYLYHYDWKVRKEGEKSVQIYISPMYVKGVKAVQKAMGKDFASRGIGVETNPSSNLAISMAESYEELPIVQMYNKDLTWDEEKLRECPQINVSINTDDKGIFHTSLENEYALMACAMEKVRDEKENLVYDRQMVYQWIDNIRRMGNLQSFKERKRGKGGRLRKWRVY